MADKRFSLVFDASMNVGNMTAALKRVQEGFEKLDLSAAGQKSFNKLFTSFNSAIKDFEAKAGKEITNMSDFKDLERSLKKISDIYDRLRTEIKTTANLSNGELLKLFPNALDDNFKNALKSLDQFKGQMKKVQEEVKKVEAEKDKQIRKRDAAQKKDATKGKKVVSSAQMADLKAERAAIKKQREDIIAERERLEAEFQKRIEEKQLRVKKDGTADKRYGDYGANQKLLDDLTKAKQKAGELETAFENIETSIKGSISQADVAENIQKFKKEAEDAQKEIDSLDAKINSLEADPALIQSFKALIAEISKLTGLDLSKIDMTADGMKQVQNALDGFRTNKIDEVRNSTRDLDTAMDAVGDSVVDTRGKIDDLGDSAKGLDNAAAEVERLTSNIMEFFSISNTVQIFKRTVQDAIETVKELDAAMTETAVVTDFNIGDMWSQLPQYTKAANELGVTTVGAYETMTLFYQQGLNTVEAFDLGTEAMKMARIAGMDYADATDKMTAALRGFNMELNASSAQRINDVYSELAAITAADTNEIATAMTKTASIADSANMEFETTAAFLSQIIETTRESAETAGTAMKTVIARFQELKKDPSEIGEVEGEIVDANKIETALRTVGVALRDSEGQFRALDEVFLELSSKWASLDTNTQRYIATIAAGSRQQSRFIAMMSNYERTMELVNAANTSAGASQKQFEKTTESMESKLNRLKNAWDQFAMGIANNEIIKAGVDLLTNLLNTINNLTDQGASGFGGIVTSILRLGTVLLSLKAGNAVFQSFTRNLRNLSGGSGGFQGFNIFGALKATGGDMKAGIKRFTGEVSYFFELLKSSEDRKDGLKIIGEAFGKAGEKATKFAGALVKALPTILAIAAAIALISKIVKDFNAAQLENQIVAAEESLGELTEGANNARQELSEIKDARSGLKNLEGQLDSLTRGTEAWEEALVNVNEQVLSLIERYPELEVTTGEYGQLSISEDSWESVIAKQNAIITNYSNAQQAAKANIEDLSKQLTLEKFIVDSGFSATGSYENFQAWNDGSRTYEAYKAQEANKSKEETRSDLDKSIDQFNYDVGQFLDSEITLFGWETGLIWGDIVAAVSDGMATSVISSSGLAPSTAQSDFNREVKNNGGYVETDLKTATGMASDQFMEMAATFAKAGITFTDGLSEAEFNLAKTLFDNAGIQDKTGQVFYGLIRQASALGSEFDALGNQMATHDRALAKYSRNFVNGAISNSPIAKEEYGDAISNILSQGAFKDLDGITEAIKETLDPDKLANEYATRFGYYAQNGAVYADAQFTQKMDVSEETMKTAIAAARASENVNAEATQMQEMLKMMSSEQVKLFSELFSTEGRGISTETLTQLSGEKTLDEIAQTLNFESAELMAKYFGMELNDLTVMLQNNFTAATDRIQKSRQNAAAKIAKATRSIKKDAQQDEQLLAQSAERLKNLEDKFGEQIRMSMESIYSSLEKSGSEALANAGLNSFLSIAEGSGSTAGISSQLNDIETFINDVNWSNPIEAAHRLNQEIEYGVGASAEYAKQLQEIGANTFGAGAQFRYFINSAEFTELGKELDGFIDKTGEVSAANVLELADGCESLQKIMKNTTATASGLARALTLLQNKDIGIHQLTDAVMASLEGFDSLDGMIAKTLKTLSEFDPGVDENEITGIISTAYDTINANLEKGAVGNNQNFSYLDLFFGSGWRKGVNGEMLSGDALVSSMKTYLGVLEANKNDMFAAWKSFAESLQSGKDMFGNAMVFDADSGRTAGDLQIDTSNGIKLTGYEGKTTTEITEWIADARNVPIIWAEMMMADLKNYSADMAAELQQNDYKAGLDAAFEKLGTVDITTRERITKKNLPAYYEDGTQGFESSIAEPTYRNVTTTHAIIDKTEIEAISKIYGMEFDEVWADVQSRGALITDFYDKDGVLRSTQEILTQIGQLTGNVDMNGLIKQFISTMTDLENTTEVEVGTKLNTDKLDAQLNAFNVPESARSQITQDIVNSIQEATNEPVYIDVQMPDGTVEAVAVPVGQSVEAAANTAIQNFQNKQLASAIAEAFGEVTITIAGVDMGTAAEVVQTTIQGDGYEVVVTCSQASLDAIRKQLDVVTQTERTTVVNGNIEALRNAINSQNGRRITTYVDYKKGTDYTAATGLKKAPHDGTALVSEKGPELIQTEQGAYLTGQNGPEIVGLNKGDTVYTAEETRDILNSRKHYQFPRYENGIHGYNPNWGYSGGRTGGNNSNEDEIKKWENPYDKLYNLVSDIDEELRRRQRMERRYEKLLEDGNATARELYNNSVAELQQLEHEKTLSESLRDSRLKQIDLYQQENSDLAKYAQVVQDEFGRSVLRINWDQINEVKDPEQGEKIETYIGQLEEWMDSIEEAEDNLEEIEDAVEDIKERGKEEYLDFEQRIKDAVINSYQEEIDHLSAINDAIIDSNADLIDAITEQISKMRQDRENEKAEESIADKQRQIMYLSQDTSGANDLRILELQNELDKEVEDYTDSLIDQKINDLQLQNDKAAEQRERQIQTAEAQLKQLEESGKIWNQVQTLLDEGLDKNTGLVRGSQLENLLKSTEGYVGMSKTQQMEWLKELEIASNSAAAYLKGLEEGFESGKYVYRGDSSNFGPITPEPDPVPKNSNSGGSSGGGGSGGGGGGYTPNPGYSTTEIKSLQKKAGIAVDGIWGPQTAAAYDKGYRPSSNADLTTDAAREEKFMTIDEANEKKKWKIYTINGSYITTFEGTYQQAQKSFPPSGYKISGPYKQGGIIDFTGPAWLDGTKSKPEYVLNADQTRGFLTLVNILDSITSFSATPAQNSGDSTYDIDINVESIGSDYDVEQLANKIKKMINSDARYRNNNAISLKR